MKLPSFSKKITALFFIAALIGAMTFPAFSAPKIHVRLVLVPGKFDEKLNKCVGGPGLCTIDLELLTNSASTKDMGIGTAELNDDKLILSLELPLRGNIAKLPLERDVLLNGPKARAFGFEEIIIRKGEYEVDKKKNRIGTITFDVKTKGEINPPAGK